MLTKELLSEYIDAGAAKRKADMAILGGTLINVNTSEYYQADVAIYKGKIVAVESDISDYIDEHTQKLVWRAMPGAPSVIARTFSLRNFVTADSRIIV